MSALSSDRKPPVDYGVQIRFIKDLHDTGGGYPEKTRGRNNATPPSNKYGVAVRVQGISGQPYVVLKDGDKGDSYGVQLKTDPPQVQPKPPSSALASPYSSLPRGKDPGEIPNPYKPEQPASSPVSSASPTEEQEAFGSPFRRPPGDGQAGTQGEGGTGREGRADRAKMDPHPKPTNGVEKDSSWPSQDEDFFNEAGLKPVGLKGVGSRDPKNGVGLTGSLGRHSGKKLDSPPETFPEPPPPVPFEEEEPVAAIDTNSLAPINKLISKFNSSSPGVQTRGRTGARQRLRFDERRRSRSLDARKNAPEDSVTPPPTATPNPYASSLTPSSTSSTPRHGSLGKSPISIAKGTALSASKPASINKTPGKFAAKDIPPAIPPKKPGMPPPLRERGRSAEVINGEEALTQQAIPSLLKEGPSDLSIHRKVNRVNDTPNHAKPSGVERNLKKDLEDCLHGNTQLQTQLDSKQTELLEAQEELTQLRMAKEEAESRVRQHEDQLAELQEELRGISENSPHTVSLQTDVMMLKAELAEAAMLRQRQEEQLHQRERELTALKGALKDEVESHDKEMEVLREQYHRDMETLHSTMEQVSQSQQQIEEERQKVNESMFSLEEELESCRDQEGLWRSQLDTATEELQNSKQDLLRARLEKDEFEEELKKLQMSMKKTPVLDDTDSPRRHDDIKQTRSELDRQRVESKKEEELRAFRAASEEKEARLSAEIDRLKDQSQRDRDELQKALEKTKELDQESTKETNLEETNTRLRERLARMRLHSSVPLSSDTEQALEDENRSLKSQLEEARRAASRAGKEKEELSRRLEERDLEREVLKRGKSDLEEQKRLLDRALEKINKEMEMMMGDSRQSLQTLQSQLDDYRERSRRDLLDAQRNSKDRLAELQRAQAAQKSLQEEASRLKKDLLACAEERDGAQLERDLLSSRLKHLESELESERSSHTDRGREIRALEDKVKTMEIELDEEKSSVELLNDRVTRSREQVDQLRADLLQERSSRHDLEMDKSSMERQVKDLKSRVADMEGQSRLPAGISLLEGKVQELEERLRSEEREKGSIQASQRRMERKLKDLNITLDQERNTHAEQRDQLALRVKALKRQVDESESEVERLEGVRRKVLRELEEQQELQDTQQAKISTLEAELKRKGQQARRPVLGSSNLSSEDEDGFYDTNSIASILSEAQLQTTNC
ncbi:cingulin isoform X2 [Hypomesus transpacificus]|uniref:cingulin isoform X2 n=1 Tax=Hypomesus transpacificus TaxID=137520 RepID=UPI001F07D5F1|nr:cingulin isoform X2 [Hypomesus transpacificus]